MKPTIPFTYCLLVSWLLLSCKDNSKVNENEFSLLSLKDSAVARNVSQFVIDSSVEKQYKSFYQIKTPLLDSLFKPFSHGYVPAKKVYLYSWQERDSLLTEFTAIKAEEEHGLGLYYFIFDKNNKLVSATYVAGLGGEGHVRLEIRSHFKSRDTLLKTHAASTDMDMTSTTPYRKMSRRKGDSTFYEIVFLKNGKTVESTIGEKKELNLYEEL